MRRTIKLPLLAAACLAVPAFARAAPPLPSLPGDAGTSDGGTVDAGALAPLPSTESPPEAARSRLVVDVAPSGHGLNPPKLREAIATALGVEVLAPTDPGAEGVKETVLIGLDNGHVVVSYAGEATHGRREAPMPADAAKAARVAIDLAVALGQQAAAAAAARKPAATPAVIITPAPVAGAGTVTPTEEDERLGRTLSYYADRDKVTRSAMGWGGLVLGAGALATGIVMATETSQNNASSEQASGYFVGAMGAGLMLGGLLSLVTDNGYSALVNVQRDSTPAAAESAWALAAAREHGARKLGGGVGMVLGAAVMVVGVIEAESGDGAQGNVGAALIGLGGLDLLLGVYNMSTEGAVESGWHAYQAAAGKEAPEPSTASTLKPQLGMVRGGGVAGISGRF